MLNLTEKAGEGDLTETAIVLVLVIIVAIVWGWLKKRRNGR